MIYYLICFPLYLLLRMDQKLPGLTKYTFQQGSLPYQKEISAQRRGVLLDISYWTLWLIPHFDLKCSLIIYLTMQAFKSQMAITCVPLPQKYGNVPLPCSWGNFYGNFARFNYKKIPHSWGRNNSFFDQLLVCFIRVTSIERIIIP